MYIIFDKWSFIFASVQLISNRKLSLLWSLAGNAVFSGMALCIWSVNALFISLKSSLAEWACHFFFPFAFVDATSVYFYAREKEKKTYRWYSSRCCIDLFFYTFHWKDEVNSLLKVSFHSFELYLLKILWRNIISSKSLRNQRSVRYPSTAFNLWSPAVRRI